MCLTQRHAIRWDTVTGEASLKEVAAVEGALNQTDWQILSAAVVVFSDAKQSADINCHSWHHVLFQRYTAA